MVILNNDKWNGLSPQNQSIIKEINEERFAKHGEAVDEADVEGVEYFISEGGEIITLTDAEADRWEAAVAPIINEYIREANREGIDGNAVVDFIKANM
jgi:TRAP-type transport system periplasmic protein